MQLIGDWFETGGRKFFFAQSNELPEFVVLEDYGGRVKAGLGKYRDGRMQ